LLSVQKTPQPKENQSASEIEEGKPRLVGCPSQNIIQRNQLLEHARVFVGNGRCFTSDGGLGVVTRNMVLMANLLLEKDNIENCFTGDRKRLASHCGLSAKID